MRFFSNAALEGVTLFYFSDRIWCPIGTNGLVLVDALVLRMTLRNQFWIESCNDTKTFKHNSTGSNIWMRSLVWWGMFQELAQSHRRPLILRICNKQRRWFWAALSIESRAHDRWNDGGRVKATRRYWTLFNCLVADGHNCRCVFLFPFLPGFCRMIMKIQFRNCQVDSTNTHTWS